MSLTHQQGFNAAAALAGAGLEPTLRLSKRKSGKPATAEVWLDVYGLGIDELAALRDRVRELGWLAELGGGTLDVTGKAVR